MNNRWRAIRKSKWKRMSKLEKCFYKLGQQLAESGMSITKWLKAIGYYEKKTINQLRKKNKRW